MLTRYCVGYQFYLGKRWYNVVAINKVEDPEAAALLAEQDFKPVLLWVKEKFPNYKSEPKVKTAMERLDGAIVILKKRKG